MIVTKTNEEWQKIVKDKDEALKEWEKIVEKKDAEIQALYKRIKDQQTINDAQKKLNGVLQTDLTEAETKIKNMVEDRLNASRGVLNGD